MKSPVPSEPPDDHRSGEAWNPEGPESPHVFDYKLSIMDAARQEELTRMIADEVATPGSVGFSLDWFREHGSFRRFTNSQEKRGLFIQASCIVTNGFRSAELQVPTHVLLTERSANQFHLPAEGRHKSGPAVLFSTVLASFDCQDKFGHVPEALFNNLHSYCPWALFARKLLLPDIHMDSRFLGIAYNFERADKRYVFLVWHVRTRDMPETMLVPVRQEKQFDVPSWMPIESISLELLQKDAIGRLVLGNVLKRGDLGNGEAQSGEATVGFLPKCRFASVVRGRETPQVVRRDEIGLDLLRMYQQEFHGGRRIIEDDALERQHERALQIDFDRYLRERLHRQRIRFTLDPEWSLGLMPKAGRADLVLSIRDENGAPMYRYLFECKLSKSSKTKDVYIAQAKEYCAALSRISPVVREDEGVDAVFLVHGITDPENRYAIQDTVTIPSENIPLHVIRIALNPIAPFAASQTVDVSHALIPFRVNGGPPEWLLFVQGIDDVCPQVLGGKAEESAGCIETPQQALLREMHEELGVTPGHVRRFHAVFPGEPGRTAGIPLPSLSVTRGVYRNYRFHPFVVFLTEAGKVHVRQMLHKPDHYARPLRIVDWVEQGFGHAPDYAKALQPYLNMDMLAEAAVAIGSDELLGGRDAAGPTE